MFSHCGELAPLPAAAAAQLSSSAAQQESQRLTEAQDRLLHGRWRARGKVAMARPIHWPSIWRRIWTCPWAMRVSFSEICKDPAICRIDRFARIECLSGAKSKLAPFGRSRQMLHEKSVWNTHQL